MSAPPVVPQCPCMSCCLMALSNTNEGTRPTSARLHSTAVNVSAPQCWVGAVVSRQTEAISSVRTALTSRVGSAWIRAAEQCCMREHHNFNDTTHMCSPQPRRPRSPGCMCMCVWLMERQGPCRMHWHRTAVSYMHQCLRWMKPGSTNKDGPVHTRPLPSYPVLQKQSRKSDGGGRSTQVATALQKKSLQAL
jgi:hypothetical protein